MKIRFNNDVCFQEYEIFDAEDIKDLKRVLNKFILNSLEAEELLLAIKNNNKISNEEFCKLFTKFFKIAAITDKEKLEYLEQKYSENFELKEIATDVTYKITDREGHGRDFSYCQEGRQVCFVVAAEKNLDINFDNIEIEQLDKLVKDGKIHIIKVYAKEINPKKVNQDQDKIKLVYKLINNRKEYKDLNEFINGKIENIDSKMLDYLISMLKRNIDVAYVCDFLAWFIFTQDTQMRENYYDVVRRKSILEHKNLNYDNH